MRHLLSILERILYVMSVVAQFVGWVIILAFTVPHEWLDRYGKRKEWW